MAALAVGNTGSRKWVRIARPTIDGLFAFYNDGYGAAGVGEDNVTVEPNRITLERAGGSAWRWDFSATYQLVPERPLSRRGRNYHTASGGCFETDYRTLTQRG